MIALKGTEPSGLGDSTLLIVGATANKASPAQVASLTEWKL